MENGLVYERRAFLRKQPVKEHDGLIAGIFPNQVGIFPNQVKQGRGWGGGVVTAGKGGEGEEESCCLLKAFELLIHFKRKHTTQGSLE